MTGPVPGVRLVRLYPRAWRDRYEAEFLAVLESRSVTRADRLDIVRGALDAWLHPRTPSMIPGAAALIGGGLWMLAAAPIMALPIALDWPGYLFETLPIDILAVVALAVALVGAWLRLDGRADQAGRRLGSIGLGVALVGHAAWLGLLIGAIAGIVYGAPLAVASTVAGLGTVLIGVALARADDWPMAGLVVIAPVVLIIPTSIVSSPVLWLAFGAVWLVIGVVQLEATTRPAGPNRPLTS